MTFDLTGTALGLTLDDWIDQLRTEYLDPHDRAELDLLAGAVTTTATTIVVTHGASKIKAQSRLEVGNEVMHVWATTTTDTWTVRRGHDGSTAVAHDDLSLIRADPRWTRIALARQLQRELRSWPVSVFAPVFANFDLAASVESIDLDGLTATTNVRKILTVRRDSPGAGDDTWPSLDAIYESSSNLTAYPSGHGLRFLSTIGTAGTVRVGVGIEHPVADLDFTADLGTAHLLNRRLADAAMLGVAGRLLAVDELGRTDSRSWRRGGIADDVPPGHLLQTGAALVAERDRLLKAESEALLNLYPMR